MTEIEKSNSKTLSDDDYEDDFEQDIKNESASENLKDQSDSSGNDSSLEKGQIETQNARKEKTTEEASDSEPEVDADNYNFTEDQKRAMMELMVQKQEDSDLLDEDPPEYNVKGRLEQLNAELANEPTPVEGDREFKVGFKPEIVDLVAPPPTFSDDESSQPNSARGDSDNQEGQAADSSSPNDSDTPQYDKYSDNEEKKEKQFVVEREGNFEVLGINELTASERALYAPVEEDEDSKDSKDNQNHKTKEDTSSSPSSKNSNNIYNDPSPSPNPRPPNQPRPNTAATVGARRNVRPAQSPRPKSASHANGSNTSLENFNYNSPYAMTPEQKEQARQLAKKQEEERIEREKRKKEEDEKNRKENEQAFQAWLSAKKEEDDRKKQENEDKNSQKSDKKSDDEAFTSWLKKKRSQGKMDKLLKRRQQQEMMESYRVVPREESEKAFKEWLRKKNSALRHQQEMEKQRNRLYNLQVKKSKKSQALVKAMKESQSFRYVDYYGYRF